MPQCSSFSTLSQWGSMVSALLSGSRASLKNEKPREAIRIVPSSVPLFHDYYSPWSDAEQEPCDYVLPPIPHLYDANKPPSRRLSSAMALVQQDRRKTLRKIGRLRTRRQSAKELKRIPEELKETYWRMSRGEQFQAAPEYNSIWEESERSSSPQPQSEKWSCTEKGV